MASNYAPTLFGNRKSTNERIPEFVLAQLCSYLTFPETVKLLRVSKLWRQSLQEGGIGVWKQPLERLGYNIEGGSHPLAPKYFIVPQPDGNLTIRNLEYAFGRERVIRAFVDEGGYWDTRQKKLLREFGEGAGKSRGKKKNKPLASGSWVYIVTQEAGEYSADTNSTELPTAHKRRSPKRNRSPKRIHSTIKGTGSPKRSISPRNRQRQQEELDLLTTNLAKLKNDRKEEEEEENSESQDELEAPNPHSVWWQYRKDAHLTQLLSSHIKSAKVEWVWTPHKLDMRPRKDLKPFPNTRVIDGVYHYGNNLRSRCQAAWLADQYLQDFSVEFDPKDWRGNPPKARGRALGCTPKTGWCILSKRRTKKLLENAIFSDSEDGEYYGLGCINNISDQCTKGWDTQFEASARLWLKLFWANVEPGSILLYAPNVFDIDWGDDGQNNDDDNGDDVEVETVVASMEETLFDEEDWSGRDVTRNSHTSAYGLDTDVMVTAIGPNWVVSCYFYMSRYHG